LDVWSVEIGVSITKCLGIEICNLYYFWGMRSQKYKYYHRKERENAFSGLDAESEYVQLSSNPIVDLIA